MPPELAASRPRTCLCVDLHILLVHVVSCFLRIQLLLFQRHQHQEPPSQGHTYTRPSTFLYTYTVNACHH